MNKKAFYWFLFFMLIAAGIAGAQEITIDDANTTAITMTSGDDNLTITSSGSITFSGDGIIINTGDGADIFTNEGNITIDSATNKSLFLDSGNDFFYNEATGVINIIAVNESIHLGPGHDNFTNKGNISLSSLYYPGIKFDTGDDNLTNEGTISIININSKGIEFGNGKNEFYNKATGNIDIQSYGAGICLSGGDDTFTNEGNISITSSANIGITLGEGNDNLYNKASGSIIINSSGRGINSGYDYDDTIVNEGNMTITSSNYRGIALLDGEDTIINTGILTISSSSDAIAMQCGDDTIINSGDLNFTAPINGGDGTDIFTWQGTETRAFAGDIKSFETIDKNGTGSWDLTGAITGADNININEGALYLNGGDGLINVANVGSLGVTSPNSIGELYAGELTLGLGTLLVDVNNAGADVAYFAGDANITGGKLLVNPLTEEFDKDWMQKILATMGTLSGEFAEVASTSALFSFEGNYTTDEAWIKLSSVNLVPVMEGASIPITPNEISQGTYIQNAIYNGASHPVIDAIIALPTPEAINKAVDTLSPEPVVSAIAASRQNVSAQHLNVTARMGGHHKGAQKGKNKFTAQLATDYYPILYANTNNADSPLNSFWVKGIYLKAENDSNDDKFGFKTDTQGLSIGRDYLNGSFLYGVSGGFSQSTIEYDEVASQGDTDTLNVSLYGSYFADSYYLDAILSYSNHNYKMDRAIPILNETATGDYRADEYSAYLKGSYPIALSGFTVTPAVSVQYSHYKQNAFTETGSSAALFVDATDSNSFVTGLGASIEKRFDYEQWKFLPHLSLTWNHEFCDTANKVKSGFAEFDSSFGTFESEGYDAGAETYNAQLGITAYKGKNFSLFVNYNLGIKEDYVSNSVTGGVKFYF